MLCVYKFSHVESMLVILTRFDSFGVNASKDRSIPVRIGTHCDSFVVMLSRLFL